MKYNELSTVMKLMESLKACEAARGYQSDDGKVFNYKWHQLPDQITSALGYTEQFGLQVVIDKHLQACSQNMQNKLVMDYGVDMSGFKIAPQRQTEEEIVF